MNSVERLAVTPIQAKKPEVESVLAFPAQQMNQTSSPSEIHYPQTAQTPLPSMDTSILQLQLNRLEERQNELAQVQQATIRSRSLETANAATLGVFKALALILSIRVALFFVLAGGFYLASVAMGHQTGISVWVLIAYSVLILFPVALIEYGHKFKPGG